jgi:hypothetical protein
MPRQSGNAIRNTRNPDRKSLRQFSFNPARPVLGNPDVESPLIVRPRMFVEMKIPLINLYAVIDNSYFLAHRDPPWFFPLLLFQPHKVGSRFCRR